MSEVQFSREEIEMVLRKEYELRADYRLQGELEESSKIISKLKAQILLASGHADTAQHFFKLLDMDSKKIDFFQVYQMGKESRAQGNSLKSGLYHCLRAMALNQKSLDFEGDLQHTFNLLIKLMPDDVTAMYPEYLLAEYRATFCGVNKHIAKFFRLGYEPLRIKLSKCRFRQRYKLVSPSTAV